MEMKLMMLLGIVFVVACLGAACSTLDEHESSARLVTMYATLKVIDGDEARAARVVDIATDIQKYATDETFLTVDLLMAEINSEINWSNLDAADELLVHELLGRLREELVSRFGVGVLPEDLRLAVTTITEWVKTAALMR